MSISEFSHQLHPVKEKARWYQALSQCQPSDLRSHEKAALGDWTIWN